MSYPQFNSFGNMPQMMSYSNPYQMINTQNPFDSKPQNSGINWVQSEEEVKVYQLTPNSNKDFIDGNNNILYLKSCDNMGMCTIRKFAITELEENTHHSDPDMSEYVRREEFDELKQLINNIGGGINEKSVSANDGQSGKHNSSIIISKD